MYRESKPTYHNPNPKTNKIFQTEHIGGHTRPTFNQTSLAQTWEIKNRNFNQKKLLPLDYILMKYYHSSPSDIVTWKNHQPSPSVLCVYHNKKHQARSRLINLITDSQLGSCQYLHQNNSISRQRYASLLKLSPDKYTSCIIIIKNKINNKV
jgi:hypothetical protein